MTVDDIPQKDRLAADLLNWYDRNKRELPWQEKKSPYRVLVSEIMLQQTRVETVKPYFIKFVEKYPDFYALAGADNEELMKLWEGLGYYSRARNLKACAKMVVLDYGGSLPADYEKLLSLPGIGSYTAGAVCAFAFGMRQPAVDGNVMRIFSRLMTDSSDVMLPKNRVAYEKIVKEFIPKERPGDFDQALIELGQTICLPQKPACDRCPISSCCQAFLQQKTEDFPYRPGKGEKKRELLTVLVITDGDKIALRRRPEKGLLAGMWELPSLPGHLSEKEMLQAVRDMKLDPIRYERLPESEHLFTHVCWNMIGYLVSIADREGYVGQLAFFQSEEISRRLAVPSAYSAYLPFGGVKRKRKSDKSFL
jgi:A/G-specific adenine glycosylase